MQQGPTETALTTLWFVLTNHFLQCMSWTFSCRENSAHVWPWVTSLWPSSRVSREANSEHLENRWCRFTEEIAADGNPSCITRTFHVTILETVGTNLIGFLISSLTISSSSSPQLCLAAQLKYGLAIRERISWNSTQCSSVTGPVA